MLLSYFKIAIRHLFKHKSFSLINISGLAIGMTCSMFILFWVADELSYDRFHHDRDRIYRVNLRLVEHDIKAAVSCVPLAEAIRHELRGVEDVLRLSTYNNDMFQVDDKTFEETRIYFADSNFFRFFTFQFVEGDPSSALSNPENIVLTEQEAIKYFGTVHNVVGKTIHTRNTGIRNSLCQACLKIFHRIRIFSLILSSLC